jgi:exosome complex exonuclease RRP6
LQRSSNQIAGSRSAEIAKPQLLFEHAPTNYETAPFKPLLKSKPHAREPLAETPVSTADEPKPHFPHPYQTEIENYTYPSSVYMQNEPIMYKPFEETSAIYVDTEVAMLEMLQELKKASEIAVDLEHHDSRSYIGVVSLMQISTRNQDWIVDTLKPWRRKLECLNEVFTDPNIVKVLHGAYMDVMWLQRDLGLYLVGLFDTHYAAKALGYTGGSLAFLLKKFINFDAQKQYQLADWRVRPLPQELLDYARSDTHFLLYIFDRMRNELIERSDFAVPDHEKDKVWDVLTKSSETSLQRYEHPIYDSDLGQGAMGWYKLLHRNPMDLTSQQFAVLRAVHKWRDDVAREQDDSANYVMPNHNIISIAKSPPSSREELISLLHNRTRTVRERAGELLSIIAQAKLSGENGPEMSAVLSQIEPRASRRSGLSYDKPKPSLVSKPPPVTVPSSTHPALPLRSASSSFWGSVWDGSIFQQKRGIATANRVSLAVPLPPLTAEIFADPEEHHATQSVQPNGEITEAAAPRQPEASVDDDVFVLKDLSKKRKLVDRSDSMAAQSNEISIQDNSGLNSKARRAQERAERKKAKRSQREAAQDDIIDAEIGDVAEHDTADEPFDYASAPSILNPPRESFASAKERKKKEKQLNPYAKALDAPKGLPRAQKEKAGKSKTFKS